MSNSQVTSSPGAPFVFDPNTPEFNFDPFPTLSYMRENIPVYWWPEAQAWVLMRYADFQTMMRDPRFSTEPRHSKHCGPELPDEQLSTHQLITKYGSFWMSRIDHARFRRVAGPLFTETAVQSYQPVVQRAVDDALSKIDGNTEFDLAEFTPSYSLQAMMHILGIPEQRREEFLRFGSAVIDAFFPAISGEALAEKMSYLPQGVAMLEEIIEERRARPSDDFLSRLIHAESPKGEVLSQRELVSMVAVMITAGCESPRHLINFTVLNLLKHPDQLELLHREPGLLRKATDEAGRYDNFAKLSLPRFSLEDVEIGGAQISKGQTVHGFFASALRDPEAFPDADRFDIRRDQRLGLLYGEGPHACIGVPMSNLIVESAVGTLFTRFPRMQLRGAPVFATDAFFRKMTSLRLDLRPREPA